MYVHLDIFCSQSFFFSLGQSAIFLLGGKTRDDAPIAMYIRSGDVMVMAGNSRLAYHAVPRILAPNKDHPIPTCLEPHFNTSPESFTEKRKETSLSTSDKKEGTECRRVKECETRYKRTKYDADVSGECGTDSSASSFIETTETKLVRQYLSTSRININIRQVLAAGQTFPN